MKSNVLLLEPISEKALGDLNNVANVIVADDPKDGIAFIGSDVIHGIVTRGKGKVDQ